MDPTPTRDLTFERALYESVVERDPTNVEALMALGEAYTQGKEYEKGLEVDLKLVRLRPQDPVAQYNLACSYALLGRSDAAFASLNKAVDLGYGDLAHVDRDADLESLRGDSRYAEVRDRLMRRLRTSAGI